MTLKAHQATAWIAARLGDVGDDPDSALGIANAAGEMLVMPPDGRTWSWLKRRTLMSTVSGQDYLNPPSDFAAALYVQYADSRLEKLEDSSVPSILDETRITGGERNFAGVIYEIPAGGSEPMPRILLAKTPTASESNIVRLWYRAGWTELADSNDEVRIPHWIYPLYRELVLAVALGWIEPDSSPAPGAPAGPHVAAVWAGPIAASALQRDAQLQRNVGLPRNTITSRAYEPEHFDETVILT